VVPPIDCRRVLIERGLRCTIQRELIYAALMASCEHPTADELFHQVRPRYPGLSLATVYNTLDAFAKVGLIRRLSPPPGDPHGACRYDADTSEHVHLVTRSGEVRDVPADVSRAVTDLLGPEVLRNVAQRTGVPVARVRVEFLEA
jgi:Fur family peroxide stress response transcriptional regulator